MAGLTAVIADLARSRMPTGMPMQVHQAGRRGCRHGGARPPPNHRPPRCSNCWRRWATAQPGMDLFARVSAGVTPPRELFAAAA